MFTPIVYIGGLEVIASGSVIAHGKEPIFISPTPPDRFKIELTFFKEDGAETQIFTEFVSTKHLRWKLQNFDNPLGIGTTAPTEIAKHSGRPLLFSLTSHLVGNNESFARVIHYTFYLGALVA